MRSVHVAEHVVHGDERFICRPGERLAKSKSHKKRSHETRAVCCSNCINIIERKVRSNERLLYYRQDPLRVLAARNLRHHAFIYLMKRNLSCNNIAQNGASVFNNSARRFIAGTFYTKNLHIL